MVCFTFDQRLRPSSNYRVDEIIIFLELIKETFGCTEFYNSNDASIEISNAYLNDVFKQLSTVNPFPETGVDWDLFTIPPSSRNDSTIRIEIHTGTSTGSIFIDSFGVRLGENLHEKHLPFFTKAVSVFHPFEAFISESSNEIRLDYYTRQQKIEDFSQPAIIRWWHYLNSELVENLGGESYVLGAPAYQVVTMSEGILIRLCQGIFSPNNTEHLQSQQRVMDYFGLT